MKAKILGLSALAILAAGCAGNREVLSTAIAEAEGMGRAAEAENIRSEETVDAGKNLSEAKQLSEKGKTAEALDAAELSRLQYRLAFADEKALDAAREKMSVEKNLEGDREVLKVYQNALEDEQNREKSK